eukprot:851245-Pyramimonas_sp.AAC.1
MPPARHERDNVRMPRRPKAIALRGARANPASKGKAAILTFNRRRTRRRRRKRRKTRKTRKKTAAQNAE